VLPCAAHLHAATLSKAVASSKAIAAVCRIAGVLCTLKHRCSIISLFKSLQLTRNACPCRRP
jgi:hypothetical protein